MRDGYHLGSVYFCLILIDLSLVCSLFHLGVSCGSDCIKLECPKVTSKEQNHKRAGKRWQLVPLGNSVAYFGILEDSFNHYPVHNNVVCRKGTE